MAHPGVIKEGRQKETSQLTDALKGPAERRGSFVPKDSQREKLVRKHRDLWCKPRYYVIGMPEVDDIMEPPSTVIDMDSVNTVSSMSALTAWRVLTSTTPEREDDVRLAKNVMAQMHYEKKNKPPVSPSIPKPDFRGKNDKEVYELLLKNDVHMNKMIQKKAVRHLVELGEMDENTKKEVLSGGKKLDFHNGKWSLRDKAAAVVATVAIGATIADADPINHYYSQLSFGRSMFSLALIMAASGMKPRLMLAAACLYLLIAGAYCDSTTIAPTRYVYRPGHSSHILSRRTDAGVLERDDLYGSVVGTRVKRETSSDNIVEHIRELISGGYVDPADTAFFITERGVSLYATQIPLTSMVIRKLPIAFYERTTFEKKDNPTFELNKEYAAKALLYHTRMLVGLDFISATTDFHLMTPKGRFHYSGKKQRFDVLGDLTKIEFFAPVKSKESCSM